VLGHRPKEGRGVDRRLPKTGFAFVTGDTAKWAQAGRREPKIGEAKERKETCRKIKKNARFSSDHDFVSNVQTGSAQRERPGVGRVNLVES